MARFQTAPVFSSRAMPQLHRWHGVAGGSLVLAIGLPLGIILAGSVVALAHAAAVPDLPVITRAASGTVASAAASTAVGLAVGLPLADLLGGLRGYTGRILRLAAWLPLAVPPLVYGLGVRRIIEVLGLTEALLDPANATLPLLPPVIAQSSTTIALTTAALVTCRRRAGSGGQAAEDVVRVLGAPALFRSWLADPAGTRTGLGVAGCLGLLHGLSSVAPALALPASTSFSLGATLLRTGTPAASALVAVTPLLLTLPLLVAARRLARTADREQAFDPGDATTLARTPRGVTAATAGVVLVSAVLPLAAVLLTGLGPVAVGAVLMNAPGLDFPMLAATSVAMGAAAVLGALLPFALSVPAIIGRARRATLPWVALALPSVTLVLAGAALGLPGLITGIALHLMLGFGAALPVFQSRWNGISRGALDSARVLGASTLQSIWWEDREDFARLLLAVLVAGAVVSLGDVAVGAMTGADAIGIGGAAVAFLATPDAERGAFAFGALLALAGIGGALALEAGRGATAAMWWRR